MLPMQTNSTDRLSFISGIYKTIPINPIFKISMSRLTRMGIRMRHKDDITDYTSNRAGSR